MAKLKDLVHVGINQDTIKIQGVDIPVIFTMQSFEYVEEAYGAKYAEFEADVNAMLAKGEFRLGKNEIRLMTSLVFAMVRSGGTECTPKELEESIPLHDLPDIFKVAMRIFNDQNFQKSDYEKIKTGKK